MVAACVSRAACREGVDVVRVGVRRGWSGQVHALPGEEGRAGGQPFARERPVTLASYASAQDEDRGETNKE